MASAEDIYVDPSALAKLYLHEPESRAMAAWRAELGGSLAVSLFGRIDSSTRSASQPIVA